MQDGLLLLPRMKLLMRLAQIVDGNAGINLSGCQGGMTEHLLQMPDGCTRTQHVRGAGMAESVRRNRLIQVSQQGVLTYDVPDRPSC